MQFRGGTFNLQTKANWFVSVKEKMYWNGFFVDLSDIFHLIDIDEKTVSEAMIFLSITEIYAFWIICLRWFLG